MSRIEKILRAMIDGTSYGEEPQSRIEAILLAIKNNTRYSDLPHSRIEEILLAIKNNTLYGKEPMSRIEEILLAKLNGVEYTKLPQSRIEELLIEWIKQEIEFEGVPPLTYEAIEGTLKNYRIYGNTVDGKSVGDRTANLFNGELQNGYWSTLETLAQTSSAVFRSFKIFLPAGTYTITFATNVNIVRLIADGAITQNIGNNLTEYTFTTQTNDDVGFSFRITGTSLVPWDNSDIMLNIGSVAIPYEPYGYEVPVTINNVTTNLYLPEPLKMVGNDAEYVDFVEQKQYFADGTSISVNLPTIFASIGMNTICIETKVVPSGVRIKGKFKKITTTYVQSIEPDNTNNKIIFVARAYRSKNDRMVRTGLVATNDPAIGVNINVNSTVITSGCKVFVKELAGVTPTTDNTKYTWTKTKVADGEIWYVRSYVEYINSDNEQLIIYSDAAKASLDGII